jgi:hypothetical protein
MLKFKKAFFCYLYKTLFFLILTIRFLDTKAQGLLFNSNDSLLTKRTLFHVFSTDVPEFRNYIYINFAIHSSDGF